MTEQSETADAPEEPQAPRAVCPLQTCNWSIPYPASGDLEEFKPELEAHTLSHDPHEFMYTISLLQQALWDAHQQTAELESALRGANFIMQSAGIMPKGPFDAPGEGILLPSNLSGLLLPDNVAQELRQGDPGPEPAKRHRTGEAKHGDVVPGKGMLVGKKITDPMVLRDLKKGEGRERL